MKDEIILNNLGLIYKVMHDLNCDFTNEDAIEEYYFAGLVGLIVASRKYDETKGKSGYLYFSIKSRILSVFDRHTRKDRDKHNPISLNTIISENGDELLDIIKDDYDFEQKLINKDYIEYLLNKLKNKRYKTFLLEYYGIYNEPLNTCEIAQKYGVTKQYVNNSIKYALQRIKKILKENK